MTGRTAAVALALLLTDPAYADAAARAHRFTGSSGFSVTYPAGWARRGASADELVVVSPGRGAQGPVIGPGQAAILVRPLGEARSDGEFSRVLDARASAGGAGRRTVPAPGGDCGELVETSARDASGPGPVELDTSFYCHARGQVLVVQLSRYADDPRQAAYRRAALAVAGSIRLPPPKP